MSQFVFNGSSRLRKVNFARDHHKSRTAIIEDAQRQRQRREEDLRRTRAAQRLQHAIRQWLATQAATRYALQNVDSLVADVRQLEVEAAPSDSGKLTRVLAARLHTACWCVSYAWKHQDRIPLHGVRGFMGQGEERGAPSGSGAGASAASASSCCSSLSDLHVYQQSVMAHYGAVVYEALSVCAAFQKGPATQMVSPLWSPLLDALPSSDVPMLLYVLLQQLSCYTSTSAPSGSEKQQAVSLLLSSVVKSIVAHNRMFSDELDEEDTRHGSCSLLPSSPAYVDRWPVVQALKVALNLACAPPALQEPAIRQQFASVLQPLLDAFPAIAPLNVSSSSSSSSSPLSTPEENFSAFAQACWRCLCAPYSRDEYLTLTANPLVMLLSATAEETTTVTNTGTGRVIDSGELAFFGLLVEECYRRIVLTTRVRAGDGVDGTRGGPLRVRVLGRLVRIMPNVQSLVESSTAMKSSSASNATSTSVAVAVVKRYLLGISCLSERLCHDHAFIKSILADHYAYNTGKSAAPASSGHNEHSQYRLLSSYLFSAEGGLRLMQLLNAAAAAAEQPRLQATDAPTVEAPTEAAPTIAEVIPEPELTEDEEARGPPTTAASAAAVSSSLHPHAPSVLEWPTSASIQQSPLEMLCNVFAWPLFTFSQPSYFRYQQESLALSAKLVRTPQLVRRLWGLYWRSCEGLRAVLPPGPVLQSLCAKAVWGPPEGSRRIAATPRGRRVPAAAETAPLLTTLPRLPTWETHPRYPMALYDPHPSLSVFFFTLLAHYVNVCAFADEMRRGDGAVLSIEECHALILALKEVVHRAHMYGVVPDTNGEAVAHAACLLLCRLHIVNEADPFVLNGAEGIWMSVGMVAAETAVASLVPRWDVDSAAVAAAEEGDTEVDSDSDIAVVGPLTSTVGAADATVALANRPGDDGMFHDSRSWTTPMRYLKLLLHAPFLVPFPARALLLSTLLAAREDRWVPMGDRPAVVHRGRTFLDIYELFHDSPMSASMENIRFVTEDGDMEAGYGRGVYRECIVSLCKEGFAAEYGLFRQTPDGYVFPNSFSAVATNDPQHLQKIRFLGAMVGRALGDGVLQDAPFALHFRNAILGRRNTLSNLKSFDAELYHQLMSLTQMDEAALQAVGLTFVYTVSGLGITREVELIKGGARMEVTPRNCLYYVHLVADFKLNREAAEQTRAFCSGLHAVLECNRLCLFDSNEVGRLFAGDEDGQMDLQDWKMHTVYDKPEDATAAQVRLFWDVVESLTRRQQSQLLKFVTSMTRPPLLGFRFLAPPFRIQLLAENASGAEFLPSAATCFSTLKLPPYRDYATARVKIVAAIEETGTFEFS